MSKPILFIDFDGTLCHDRFWRGLPKDRYEKVQEFLFREDKSLIQEWMKGKRTAEEINQQIAEKLGVPYENVWKIFIRDVETMSVSLQTSCLARMGAYSFPTWEARHPSDQNL